ncbi:MAG: helix-turn-helix domain-containing protein [Chloroflexota bacterium]|nr:helix-turn-helix domain-containing protein [Chloroflexota bacterium]
MSARTAASSSRHDVGPKLGTWIRATRMDQGISQRALAERSGLSRSYLCDIERGRGAQPSVTTIDKLAGALGASRADLMRAAGLIDTPVMPRENADERRLLAVYRDLSDAGRITVMRFARFVHGDEHRWIQSALLGEPADIVVDHRPDSEPSPHTPNGLVLFEIDSTP